MIYGGRFDPDVKKVRIKELENEMNSSNFWDDKTHSEEVLSELNFLKSKLSKIEELKNKIESNLEIVEMLKENSDEELLELVINDIKVIEEEIELSELELLLSGPYDKCDCILEIHPGAGGTESCDWASMLYRMYTRWCEKNDKKIELLDYQDGEEAGTFLTLYTYNCIDNPSIGNHSVEIIYDENNVAVGQFTIVKYIPEGAVYKVAATGETFGYGGDFLGAPAVGDTFNYNGVEYYFESNEDHTGWCTDDWEDNFLHVINGWPVG